MSKPLEHPMWLESLFDPEGLGHTREFNNVIYGGGFEPGDVSLLEV